MTRNGGDGDLDADDGEHGFEKENNGEKEEDAFEEGSGGEAIQLVPGMLRSYDMSTGLFGIRYSFGNR